MIMAFRTVGFLCLLVALALATSANAHRNRRFVRRHPIFHSFRTTSTRHRRHRRFLRRHPIIDPFKTFGELNKRKRRYLRFKRKCGALAHRFPTLDGSCNNKRHFKRGAAETTFWLVVPRRGKGPSGRNRPNPRKISNEICDDPRPRKNRRRMSELVTFFGQFLDHTISETENEKTAFPIKIPEGDKVFKGGNINFFRTRKEKTRRGYSPVNLLTSFIDAASVYGAHKATADKLRRFQRGLLKEGRRGELTFDRNGFFMSGDKRVNENPTLIAMHTLFMREHNRLCAEICRAFPHWNDEMVYQMARKIVIAEMQSIVYYEFIPTVIGRRIPWRGYRPRVNPSVSDEFSTVAYRVGHTLINPHMTFISKRRRVTRKRLRDVFFRPDTMRTFSVEDCLRGCIKTRAAEVDVHITSEVRNFLQGSPTAALRLDLAALNIQRGRDHRTPSYNQMRRAFHLRPARRFSDITRNRALQRKLKKTYGRTSRIDAWVGGLAEDHVRRSSLGPLFQAVWIDEFRRIRDGDRFYFEKGGNFQRKAIRKIRTLRLLMSGRYRGRMMRNIILWNGDISPREIRGNIWKVRRGRKW